MNTLFSSKFVRLLQTLSTDEYKAFELWLKSPWCNSNKNLIRLLEKLKRYHPAFDSDKLTKEKLFLQILPAGKFSQRRMNNLLSAGYLAAERFLIFQNLSQDENLQKDLLSKELQARHLDEWFFKDMDKEITRLEEKPVKEWEDHLQLFQLQRRIYHHPNQSTRMQPGRTTITKMGEELDLLYLLEKAAIINEKIFRNRILKDENHEVVAELQQWEAVNNKIDHISMFLFSKRFAYDEEHMLKQYFEIKEIFLSNFEKLNKTEQKIHLLSLINDTNLLIRKGLLDMPSSLPLYKLGLSTGILLHQGILPYNIYTTIISASNTRKDFTFTNHVIDSYTDKLDKPYQTDALNWAKAHTAYRQKKFMLCLDILLAYKFKILYFQLVSRILNTQVYFDLHLQDDSYQSYLFTYFDSFEKWLLREKLRSKFAKKAYLRFIQKCRMLAKYYNDVNVRMEKIEQLLEDERNIQALNWLKERQKLVISVKTGRSSKI